MDLREKYLSRAGEAETAPVTFYGDELFVRVLPGEDRDWYQTQKYRWVGKGRDRHTEPELGNVRAKLVVLALCDAAGNAVFARADVAEVGRLDGRELDRVYEAACRLNGLDHHAEQALEDAEKNSTPTRNGCSGTASPATSA